MIGHRDRPCLGSALKTHLRVVPSAWCAGIVAYAVDPGLFRLGAPCRFRPLEFLRCHATLQRYDAWSKSDRCEAWDVAQSHCSTSCEPRPGPIALREQTAKIEPSGALLR